MTTGDKIRQARLKRGLTQAQAAEAAGIGQSAWSQIESGRIRPTLPTLEAIAAALAVKPARLL